MILGWGFLEDFNTACYRIGTDHCINWRHSCTDWWRFLEDHKPADACWRLFEPSLKLHCVPLISVWIGSKHTGNDTWRFLEDQQSVDASVSSMWTPDGNAAADAHGKWMLRAYWKVQRRVHWVSVSQVSGLFRQHSIVRRIDFISWAEFIFQGTSEETKFVRGVQARNLNCAVHSAQCAFIPPTQIVKLIRKILVMKGVY